MPYLTILAEFRDNVRNSARNLKAIEILKECDNVRDEILPNVGVRLEDREGDWFSVNIFLCTTYDPFRSSKCCENGR